jgi:hypothetical protein
MKDRVAILITDIQESGHSVSLPHDPSRQTLKIKVSSVMTAGASQDNVVHKSLPSAIDTQSGIL